MVHLPIRSRRTVHRDGSSRAESFVFCPLLARSTPTELCTHCTRVESVTQQAMTCRIELPRDDGRPRVDVSEAAARTYVGEALRLETVCVRDDASLELALGLLDGNGCVPVVADSGRLVGVVRPGTGRGVEPARTTAASGADPVGDTLPEAMPLSLAIVVVARAARQPLPVLTPAGSVVGAFGALDIVRWVSRRMGYEIG